jgi:hypothetical protein
VKETISFTAQTELNKQRSDSLVDKAPTVFFTPVGSSTSNIYNAIQRNKIKPVDNSLEPTSQQVAFNRDY